MKPQIEAKIEAAAIEALEWGDLPSTTALAKTQSADARTNRRWLDATGAIRAYLDREAPVPSEEPVAWDRERVCAAAKAANYAYQQWMPQQWIDLFIKAYEAKP